MNRTMLNVMILSLLVAFISGCSDGSKYDKLILTDNNTGKQYLMKHNMGDTYYIDEKVTKISGKDTIDTFE